MPIVVDEVVISVDVTGAGAGGGGAAASGGQGSGAATPGGDGGADSRQIVEECVERVLEILAAREER